MVEVTFKKYEKEVSRLIGLVKLKLREIDDDKLLDNINEFNKKVNALNEKIKFEIAFVGQYSAGKSTIISALTNNSKIKIGKDICTDEAIPYSWGNVLLVDTPGIYAGRPDHDEKSLAYMNKADLLVYVITTQGFTSKTGPNFRHLAFDEDRADKIMLVINKSSQGDKQASLDNWIFDALTVTEPKTANDLYLSVIDAKDYIEGLNCTDETEQKEYMEYSGFENFIENLNLFILEKGMIGRLIAPLNLIDVDINNIINQLTAENEDVVKLQELLSRKLFRIKESKRKLQEVIDAKIKSLESSVVKEANVVANLIERDGDQDELKATNKRANENIKELSVDMTRSIEEAIEREFESLTDELEILMNSDIAQSLKDIEFTDISFNTEVEFNSVDMDKVNSATDVLKNIGNFANGFAKNADKVKKGMKGLKVVANSDAHKAIYDTGKFFGHNFKPYEAVKYADKIGKIGALAGKAAVVLPILIVGYEEYNESKHAKKIKEARQEIRQAYNDLAKVLKTSFNVQFQKLLDASYDIEIKSINEQMKSLRTENNIHMDTVKSLNGLIDEAKKIIFKLTEKEIQKE